ncbi:MAG: polysaccharide deacetylase family protein [Chloracidobacterium sp.]|nr:polysaccharide deacetylase family protein [Chloracidobacterium sp.]
MKSSVEGVHIVNSSHIVNGTLNINETVALAENFFSHFLAFLKERNLKITFFIVGQDAALEKNRAAIRSIYDAGHEIANHSFNHEPWLHLYSRDEIVEEFEKTETAIESITGTRPVGFRGPGFSLSPTVIDVLGERGYEYDCSTLPTYVAPLARAFYFLKSPKMSTEEKEKLKKLFGKFSDGFQTLKPHFVETAGKSLVEIPVTTFPIVKTPIHATYLLYLSAFSPLAAKAYWRTAVAACSLTGVQPSLLLHPLDFLSGDDIAELKFFPGMNMPSAKKLNMLSDLLCTYTDKFDVIDMGKHARLFRSNAPAGLPQHEALL